MLCRVVPQRYRRLKPVIARIGVEEIPDVWLIFREDTKRLDILTPCLARRQPAAIDRDSSDNEQIVRQVQELARLCFALRSVDTGVIGVTGEQRIEAGLAELLESVLSIGDRAICC